MKIIVEKNELSGFDYQLRVVQEDQEMIYDTMPIPHYSTQDCAQAIAWALGSPDAEIIDWFEDDTAENAPSSALDDIKDPENATIVGTFLAWHMDHSDDMRKFCTLMVRLGAVESSDNLYKQLEMIDIEEGIALIGKLYNQYVQPYRKQQMN